MLFRKLIRKYSLAITIFIVTFMCFWTVQIVSVKSQGAAVFLPGDIVTGKNVTQNETSYHDPVNAKDGEIVRIKLMILNTGDANAEGVVAKFDLRNPTLPSGQITSTNTPAVGDGVVLNPGGKELNYIAGTAIKFGPGCINGCSVGDATVADGIVTINLGTVEPGTDKSYQVMVDATVKGVANPGDKPQFKGGNIMDGGDRSTGDLGWKDPISANPGDIVEFRLWVINEGKATAKSVLVKANLPSAPALHLVTTGQISAPGADSVSDTVTVNVSGTVKQGLNYYPGHAKKYGPGCESGCTLPDDITVYGVAIGDVQPGESYQIVFKVSVSRTAGPTATPAPTPTPTPTGSPAPTPTPTVTPTSTPTATPTETPGPTGAPNSCNGTCGSNYNCQGGYFCYQGFCRAPACPNDSSCGCVATPTPTAPPVILGSTAPPILPKTGSNLLEIIGGLLGIAGTGFYFFKKFKLI